MHRRGLKNKPGEWPWRCPNGCRTQIGRFCYACGEHRERGKDFSLVSHLGETFIVFTNIDETALRSFGNLITKPGLLTEHYVEGRRRAYLKPLQIFIFCNIIFFFVQSYTTFNRLSEPLYFHMQQARYSSYARAKVSKTIIDRGITFKDYQMVFDATIKSQSKTLIVLMIPVFALLLQMLYWRARVYFVEHLVFSIHFFSCSLLILSVDLLLTTAIARIARQFPRLDAAFDSDHLSTVVLLTACLGYLLFAVRRVYTQIYRDSEYRPGWVTDALRCAILIVGLVGIVQFYRFCLFFTAFYWIETTGAFH